MSEKKQTLKEKNSHPRDERIEFDEEPHVYYIDGKDGYISSTTFIHEFFDGFDATAVISKMRQGKNWENHEHYGKTDDEIREVWKQTAQEASQAGTKMHKYIEDFYNGIEPPQEYQETKEWGMFMKFYDDFKHLVPYRTEWEIFDEEYKIAGSIDIAFLAGTKDGKVDLILGDWKRSKAIQWSNVYERTQKYGKIPLDHIVDCNAYHYSLQLNLYRKILEKNYGVSVSQMFLIRIHPGSKRYQKIDIDLMDMEIRDMLLVRKHQLKNLQQ